MDLSDYFSVENGIAEERECVYGLFWPKLTFAYLPRHCIHRRSEGLLAFAAKQSEGGASKLSNVERFLKFGAEGHGEGKGWLFSSELEISSPLSLSVLHDASVSLTFITFTQRRAHPLYSLQGTISLRSLGCGLVSLKGRLSGGVSSLLMANLPRPHRTVPNQTGATIATGAKAGRRAPRARTRIARERDTSFASHGRCACSKTWPRRATSSLRKTSARSTSCSRDTGTGGRESPRGRT